MRCVLAFAVGLTLAACDLAFGLNGREPAPDAGIDAPTCSDLLTMPVTDSWGQVWDGMEHAPASFEAATAACDQFGARLPTATELYRVNATTSSAIGQSFHTNYLWTLVPWGRTDQASVRISDGTATAQPALSPLAYRCTCAPPKAADFSGTHCNGPPGTECFRSGRLNVDTNDRAALRRSAAIFECAYEHAHLADLPALVEAVQAGLPGSNMNLATADQSNYQSSTTMRWIGVMTNWSLVNTLGTVGLVMPAPFRCAGPAVAVEKPAVPTGFAGSFYASETVDSPGSAWGIAHSTCMSRGGHIPRSSELAELIMQGLPAGSDTYLWTSDQSGVSGSGTTLQTALLRWSGLDLRFPYEWQASGVANTSAWDTKSVVLPFRCIYYPIDPAFTEPTACNGGCFEVPIVGPSRMVFDSVNRTLSSLAGAHATCGQLGGHLATARDLTEAIRAGLVNGNDIYLFTAEIGGSDALVTIWGNAAEPNFTDQYQAGSSYSGINTSRPFRCMWTNELR